MQVLATEPEDLCVRTMASTDLNNSDLASTLPEELGLLSNLVVFHLNSNRFCGGGALRSLHLLHEINRRAVMRAEDIRSHGPW